MDNKGDDYIWKNFKLQSFLAGHNRHSPSVNFLFVWQLKKNTLFKAAIGALEWPRRSHRAVDLTRLEVPQRRGGVASSRLLTEGSAILSRKTGAVRAALGPAQAQCPAPKVRSAAAASVVRPDG